MATIQYTPATRPAIGDVTAEHFAVGDQRRADATGWQSHGVSAHVPFDAARLAGMLTLRDGACLHLRAIQPDDTERLRVFHARLSRDTVLLRFFRYMPELSVRDAERFTHLDYVDRMALVVTQRASDWTNADERILAVAQYDRIDRVSAEVAFVVADEWQGHGIATALLLQLADYARAHRISRLVAITMPSNERMLAVLRRCGYPCTTRFLEGEDEVSLNIAGPPALVHPPPPFIPDVAN